MLLRYVMRLVRFTLYFDPETMTVGQMVRDEMPSGLSPPLTDR
jgi:C4-dicarboxylate transporter, DctQ subunit